MSTNNNVKNKLNNMRKVYIVEVNTNKEYEFSLHHIEHVFGTYDDADKWIEETKKSVQNKTSKHFTDKKNGWLSPVLVDDYSNQRIHIKRALTYKWRDNDSGYIHYTHFRVCEYDLE